MDDFLPFKILDDDDDDDNSSELLSSDEILYCKRCGEICDSDSLLVLHTKSCPKLNLTVNNSNNSIQRTVSRIKAKARFNRSLTVKKQKKANIGRRKSDKTDQTVPVVEETKEVHTPSKRRKLEMEGEIEIAKIHGENCREVFETESMLQSHAKVFPERKLLSSNTNTSSFPNSGSDLEPIYRSTRSSVPKNSKLPLSSARNNVENESNKVIITTQDEEKNLPNSRSQTPKEINNVIHCKSPSKKKQELDNSNCLKTVSKSVDVVTKLKIGNIDNIDKMDQNYSNVSMETQILEDYRVTTVTNRNKATMATDELNISPQTTEEPFKEISESLIRKKTKFINCLCEFCGLLVPQEHNCVVPVIVKNLVPQEHNCVIPVIVKNQLRSVETIRRTLSNPVETEKNCETQWMTDIPMTDECVNSQIRIPISETAEDFICMQCGQQFISSNAKITDDEQVFTVGSDLFCFFRCEKCAVLLSVKRKIKEGYMSLNIDDFTPLITISFQSTLACRLCNHNLTHCNQLYRMTHFMEHAKEIEKQCIICLQQLASVQGVQAHMKKHCYLIKTTNFFRKVTKNISFDFGKNNVNNHNNAKLDLSTIFRVQSSEITKQHKTEFQENENLSEEKEKHIVGENITDLSQNKSSCRAINYKLEGNIIVSSSETGVPAPKDSVTSTRNTIEIDGDKLKILSGGNCPCKGKEKINLKNSISYGYDMAYENFNSTSQNYSMPCSDNLSVLTYSGIATGQVEPSSNTVSGPQARLVSDCGSNMAQLPSGGQVPISVGYMPSQTTQLPSGGRVPISVGYMPSPTTQLPVAQHVHTLAINQLDRPDLNTKINGNKSLYDVGENRNRAQNSLTSVEVQQHTNTPEVSQPYGVNITSQMAQLSYGNATLANVDSSSPLSSNSISVSQAHATGIASSEHPSPPFLISTSTGIASSEHPSPPFLISTSAGIASSEHPSPPFLISTSYMGQLRHSELQVNDIVQNSLQSADLNDISSSSVILDDFLELTSESPYTSLPYSVKMTRQPAPYLNSTQAVHTSMVNQPTPLSPTLNSLNISLRKLPHSVNGMTLQMAPTLNSLQASQSSSNVQLVAMTLEENANNTLMTNYNEFSRKIPHSVTFNQRDILNGHDLVTSTHFTNSSKTNIPYNQSVSCSDSGETTLSSQQMLQTSKALHNETRNLMARSGVSLQTTTSSAGNAGTSGYALDDHDDNLSQIRQLYLNGMKEDMTEEEEIAFLAQLNSEEKVFEIAQCSDEDSQSSGDGEDENEAKTVENNSNKSHSESQHSLGKGSENIEIIQNFDLDMSSENPSFIQEVEVESSSHYIHRRKKSAPRQQNSASNDNNEGFPCDLCTLVFKRADYLKKHKELHLKKPFTCWECLMTFSSAKMMKKHNQHVHRDL